MEILLCTNCQTLLPTVPRPPWPAASQAPGLRSSCSPPWGQTIPHQGLQSLLAVSKASRKQHPRSPWAAQTPLHPMMPAYSTASHSGAQKSLEGMPASVQGAAEPRPSWDSEGDVPRGGVAMPHADWNDYRQHLCPLQLTRTGSGVGGAQRQVAQ